MVLTLKDHLDYLDLYYNIQIGDIDVNRVRWNYLNLLMDRHYGSWGIQGKDRAAFQKRWECFRKW